MVASLGSPVTLTSESLYSSLTALMDANSVGVVVGFSLPATIQGLLFELHAFQVLHTPILFPVEHGWNSARCNIVSSSGDLKVLKKLRSNLFFRSLELNYASSFEGCQKHQFSTEKCIYTPPLPVSPFDDRLDYIRYLNIILLRLNGPRTGRNVEKNAVWLRIYSRKT